MFREQNEYLENIPLCITGIVKKHWGTSKAASPICRKNFANQFFKDLLIPFLPSLKCKTELKYGDLKQICGQDLSPFYAKLKDEIQQDFLRNGSGDIFKDKQELSSKNNDFLVSPQ